MYSSTNMLETTSRERCPMFFCCENCHYVFEMTAQLRRCPDCGSLMIRPATDEEKAERLRQMEIAISDNWDNITKKAE